MKKILANLIFVCIFLVYIFAGCNLKEDNANSSLTEPLLESPLLAETDNISFDVNVEINIKVTLDDSVKDVDPNIIRAARAAVFDYYCVRAKQLNYNKYSVDNKMNIFEVEEIGKDNWRVKYRGENDSIGTYHIVDVVKEESGSFKGLMFYSNPPIKRDETY